MKKLKNRPQRMSAADALDMVGPEVGDYAALMMASEMAGMDYDAFISELANGEPTIVEAK